VEADVLGRLGTALKWIILLPVLIAVVLLAVANDQSVTVHLNPFDTADPVLQLDLALYQVAFLVFVIGVLAGGLIAWAGQRKYRIRAHRREEAVFARTRGAPATRQAGEGVPRVSAYLPRPERG
jgi:uncharacterized integral membrane protein